MYHTKLLVTRCSSVAFCIAAMSGSALATEAGYVCSDGSKVEAQFSDPAVSPGSVVLTFSDGRELALPQALSADGGRYAEGDTEFWIKGNSATFTHHGKVETCETK